MVIKSCACINGNAGFLPADLEQFLEHYLREKQNVNHLLMKLSTINVSLNSLIVYLFILENIIIILSVSESEATLYGKENEPKALDKLAEVCGLNISEPSKCVPKDQKWLVCIPDGVVRDDEDNIEAIVEVKCPFKCAQVSLETVAKSDG